MDCPQCAKQGRGNEHRRYTEEGGESGCEYEILLPRELPARKGALRHLHATVSRSESTPRRAWTEMGGP